ncbi:hypothetical protein GALMADRAFT_136316 [Galerina marginata CBS 339.88]|uniref:Uncharacterized protein n=1 Tax=Galerina marginata (strain CBS 339.88) TaxID=685588 RepID=A0A067TDQ5_GALM3|nr:hypothetical protein GALMADRAFT_136316 [Galerina marginata CBS 339.88]
MTLPTSIGYSHLAFHPSPEFPLTSVWPAMEPLAFTLLRYNKVLDILSGTASASINASNLELPFCQFAALETNSYPPFIRTILLLAVVGHIGSHIKVNVPGPSFLDFDFSTVVFALKFAASSLLTFTFGRASSLSSVLVIRTSRSTFFSRLLSFTAPFYLHLLAPPHHFQRPILPSHVSTTSLPSSSTTPSRNSSLKAFVSFETSTRSSLHAGLVLPSPSNPPVWFECSS